MVPSSFLCQYVGHIEDRFDVESCTEDSKQLMEQELLITYASTLAVYAQLLVSCVFIPVCGFQIYDLRQVLDIFVLTVFKVKDRPKRPHLYENDGSDLH